MTSLGDRQHPGVRAVSDQTAVAGAQDQAHCADAIIFLLCTVGAFASASRLFDIYCMLAIGIGAFFLRRRGYQMAPFVLGLVLGGLLDKSLRRAWCYRMQSRAIFLPDRSASVSLP